MFLIKKSFHFSSFGVIETTLFEWVPTRVGEASLSPGAVVKNRYDSQLVGFSSSPIYQVCLLCKEIGFRF